MDVTLGSHWRTVSAFPSTLQTKNISNPRKAGLGSGDPSILLFGSLFYRNLKARHSSSLGDSMAGRWYLPLLQTPVQGDRLTLTELSQQIWSYKCESEEAILRKMRGQNPDRWTAGAGGGRQEYPSGASSIGERPWGERERR